MTITQSSLLEYMGLSSDAKPDDAVVGARLVEYDSDREYRFDGSSWRAIDRRVIASEHLQIHRGRMWVASALYSAIPNLGFADLVFTIGDDPVHAIFRDFAGGEASILIYEDADVEDGQAVTPRNANRVAGDDSPPFTAVQSDGSPALTVNSGGTLIEVRYNLGMGDSPLDRAGEVILAASTVYLFRIWNGSGGEINAAWNVRGYS